mgnify:CR=1 FL=1
MFDRLSSRNPSPYLFYFNLGQEQLIGSSPEMFLRVEDGRTIETCPIAGTIRRGADAVEDAVQRARLYGSLKDESELTMCTDVDRNDKARICEPGSVRVIGRRQVEMYSRLMHTVDHVVGTLREDRDALDAFLAHTWAVTVTGAPKPDALQFIEDHEKSARGFYSGAVGAVMFNGDLNTGLTLRTARLRDGVVEVRAGATLLHASDPTKEARECVLKASAVFDALRAAIAQDLRAGVLPLAISSGAGAGARHSVGTGVMGGMLAATFLAIFFVPMFFRLITDRKFREARSTAEMQAEAREAHEKATAREAAARTAQANPGEGA